MLKKLVIEILLGEFCIKRQERTILLCRVCEGAGIGNILFPVFAHLLLSGFIVGLGCLHITEQTLHICPVHIRLSKVRVEFDCLVIVFESIAIKSHLNEDGSSVEICKDILRIDVEHTVHIIQGILICS